MKQIFSYIFKQYDIGQWWGAAKSTFANASIYMAIFNTAMIVPMAYVTWISPWLQLQGMSMPFWVFGGIILVGATVAMLFEYKLSLPSIISFGNEQNWKHDNPIRAKLNNIEKRMSERFDVQDERLKRMERLLEKNIRN